MNTRVHTTAVLSFAMTAILAASACTAGDTELGSDDGVVVSTTAGMIRGTVDGSGHRLFTSVPYAQPPLNELRWQPPRPMALWDGVRDAAAPTPGCVQDPGQTSAQVLQEDCLYLNISTPARLDPARPAPVMVWIHGGGGFAGAGADYRPTGFVSRGVVVVTINYRLSVFGLFNHPAFASSGGNLALQDQQLALRWVRDNIAAFGGNARNVTVAGESYGGMSICAQLAMPSSAGLFDRAIVQSGSCAIEWPSGALYSGSPPFAPYRSRTDNAATAVQAATEFGCSDPAEVERCLRALPTATLQTRTPSFTTITYDTPTLPRNPFDALRVGKFSRVPVLIGEVTNGHSLWVAAIVATQQAPITSDSYRSILSTAFGTVAAAVEADYPVSAYPTPAAALTAVLSDHSWACPMLDTARALAARVPVYTYEFADMTTPAPSPYPPSLPTGAAHGAELTYLFDLTPSPGPVVASSQPLATAMLDYWAHFIGTGNPNQPGLPHWSRSTISGDAVLRLTPGSHGITTELADNHHCNLW
ncbi:carboxylesterase/lipase family protein [Nocardia sp. NPDC050408]|uniref:carboxylesterase/lipase family protein n=1 Tax=Nocardia sp. NPDC050408 TaxID=3364319 RepID=UPI0037B70445